MSVGGVPLLTHRFFVLPLYDVAPEILLSMSPHLAALVPLSRRASEVHVRQAAARVASSKEPRTTDLLAVLAVLAARRFPDDLIEAIIPEEALMKNPLIEKIRKKGREEGREEGRCQALREAILAVLRGRFGQIPSELSGQLETVRDATLLTALLDRAVTVVDPRNLIDEPGPREP